ncbi:Uncharacterised protein [Candidatus Tiddalikarchaeum anstoanum]|nr:Uncharacterised protein [Candidatus Tiddalikarchaeum anstoanum]
MVLHIAFTYIILRSLSNPLIFALAVFFHFATDMIASILYYIIGLNIWLVELSVFGVSILSIIVAYKLNKESKTEVKEVTHSVKRRISRKNK